MGDGGYPPIRIPGVQGPEKDSSDSDPEAVAARKQRKRNVMLREQANEQREAEAQRARQERDEAMADKEQVLHILCTDEEAAKVYEFMKSIDCPRPEDFEERLQGAATLREKAKTFFEESQVEAAVRHWMGAAHCLDFTPRQMTAQDKKDRHRVFEALAPLLSNLSLASRKLGDHDSAIRAADVGLEVVRKMPYEASKPLRVKLRLRRAIARGELRDFQGARDDARHVLDLSPGHEEAACIVRNSETALRREGGPKEQRWKASLTTPLPKKKVQQVASGHGRIAVMLASILGPVLLAVYFARSASAAPS